MSVKVTVKMVCEMLTNKKNELERQLGNLQDDFDSLEEAIEALQRGDTDTVLTELFDTSKPKAPAKKKVAKKTPPKTKKHKTTIW